ncbi:T9SS type A sorting domain-containing protein [Hallerella porci]
MQTILWDQFYYSIYRYPYMIEVENGGGYVSNNANVAASAYVGENAVVNAGTVSGNARIEDFAVVDGGTISGDAVVKSRAYVTSGTISDKAVLEDDAWLVSGAIKDNAKVGALTVLKNTTVSSYAQVYGVMRIMSDKQVSGTAQLRGDLENNFTQNISQGVFYGIVDDGMLNNVNYGASLTEAKPEVTASIEKAVWYDVDEPTPEIPEEKKEEEVGIKNSIANNFKPNITITENEIQISSFLNHKVYIFDLQGKLLLNQELNASRQTLSIENLPSGIYLLKVQNSKAKASLKFRKN